MASPKCKTGARRGAAHSNGWQEYGMYRPATNMPHVLDRFQERTRVQACVRSLLTRWSRSAGGSATANSLSRLAAPLRSATAAGRTPKASATARRAASVARPSTAGALTATTRAGPYGPEWLPPTRVRDAPGFTRTATVADPGWDAAEELTPDAPPPAARCPARTGRTA